MQYYEDNGRTAKRAGAIAAVAYIALWAVLMLVVNITLKVRETGEGILIDFGDTDQAGGSMAAVQTQYAENRRPANPAPPVVNPEDMMTQDYEDAPEVPRRQTQPERRPSETPQQQPKPQQPQQAAPPAEEQPRQPDPSLLFPGNNRQGNDTSQGTGTGEGMGTGAGPGRQGSPDGTPGGDPAGTGTGNGGTEFNLVGRSAKGDWPEPRYGPNKEGRVIVDITVDATGKIIRAVPRGKGSTTIDSELVSAALKATEKSQFNAIDGDGLQNGTITYNFILK